MSETNLIEEEREERERELYSNAPKAVASGDMVRPWVGKLHHSRELIDDWGWIRDETGVCIMMVRIPYDQNVEELLHEHRRNGTDPTQARVDAILALLNGPNASALAVANPTPAQHDR